MNSFKAAFLPHQFQYLQEQGINPWELFGMIQFQMLTQNQCFSTKKDYHISQKSCKSVKKQAKMSQGNQQQEQDLFDPQQKGIFRKSSKKMENSYISKSQKSNRNIKSNILKYFVKYLMDDRQMQPQVQIICEIHNIQMSFKQFKQILKKKLQKNPSYIRPCYIRQLCFGVAVPQSFSKIIRILLRKFLKAEFQINIQSSSKINREMKFLQVQEKRKLLKDILKLQK